MNHIRISINAALSVLLGAGGIHLLTRESFFLRDRWQPEIGTLFSGASLLFLASGLLLLAAFAAMIALGWARGSVPMPTESIRPHPAYKGRLIARYWTLTVPALICIILAFVLADTVPEPVAEAPSRDALPYRSRLAGESKAAGAGQPGESMPHRRGHPECEVTRFMARHAPREPSHHLNLRPACQQA